MKRLVSTLAMVWAMAVCAQTATQNYVLSQTMLDVPGTKCVEQISYFDGLGRLTQTVDKGVTPSGADLVTLTEYVGLTRDVRSWLPVVSTANGNYVAPAEVMAAAKSSALYGNDTYPYSEKIYELSSLGRVTQQYGTGSAWRNANRAVSTELTTNKESGELSCLRYSVTDDNKLYCHGTYPRRQLWITKTTDEDNNVSYEFKDVRGNVILQRSMLNGENIDTYYVYDDYNNLTYVLPHLAAQQLQSAGLSWAVDDEYISRYGYYYEYTGHGLCTLKKLPGAEPIRMIYDALGNLVFSQDGVQRAANEWSFQLYDGQLRPTVSGRFTYSGTPKYERKILSNYTGTGSFDGYNSAIDFSAYSNVVTEKVLYYDNYDFIDYLTDSEKSALTYAGVESPYTEAFKVDGKFKVAGMQTGVISYVLGDTVRSVSAAYYDIRGRNVQTRSTNFKGGAETVLTAYTFSGKELYKKIATNINGEELITQQYEYHYDHAERPTETYLTVNGGAKQLLTKLCYDEVGRLATRTHGNNVTETYDYNIRSWVTDINSSAFSEHLRYEQAGQTPECYVGNIASMMWTVNADAYTSEGAFHNSYDGLGRLTQVQYESGTDSYANFARYEYDALGNIIGLQRQGVLDDGSIGDIDNLTYSYDGNQLVKVDDSADAPTYSGAMHFIDDADDDEEYQYDANGNMTADLNNSIISILYNSLNLPSSVAKGFGRIAYTYTSTGEKIRTDYSTRQIVADSVGLRHWQIYNTYTEYCGNHIFENGELKMTLFDGGFVTYNEGEPGYHFYVRDHQGNNRLVMSEDGIVEQVNDYTPFGVQMKNSFAETSDQRYKYNGKELDRMLGLDLYDYGARFYDARIARWQTIDPLCEKYYSISPYAYCANNPIRFIDPDGKVIIFINGQNNGDGGTPAYWDGIDKTIKNGLGEKKALYYDGSSGGWDNTKKALKGLNSNLNVKYRIAAGREKGYKEAANIINSLGRGEKINFVSHSMGSAYTKGFIQGMLDYASKNDIDTSNLFGFELDLAPFQPKDQKAIKGVDTWVIQHQFDGVAGTGDMLDADIEVSHTDLPFYKLINLITFF